MPPGGAVASMGQFPHQLKQTCAMALSVPDR
jgi:hypothetical protein